MNTSIVQLGASGPVLKIMVVDDTPANLKMMRSALEMLGNVVITAASGEEALVLFLEQQPDVILMDVCMPGIGGIETTRRLREMAGDRWLPILFVSALSHSEDMVLGLEAGGDDYLAKPVDIPLLRAKIRALARIADMQDSLRRANTKLRDFHHAAEHDMELARAVMDQMVRCASMSIEGVDLWLAPAAELSGDLLVARKGYDGRIYLLLADAKGHGLPAALPVMPAMQVFTSMTRGGHTIPAIAREMNAKLKGLLPAGNFVAVTLVSIDPANRLIDIWNGGNPPALLLDSSGQVSRRFDARHPALGIFSDAEFDSSTEACQWNDAQKLMFYSDGLVEARDPQGNLYGEERLLARLATGCSHNELRDGIIIYLDGVLASDDISLATISLNQLT